MSSNTDPLPPGLIPIAVISPSLQGLMIGQSFIVLAIPFLIALFYYSTPHSRRQPIFILNVFALILAIATAVANHVLTFQAMLSPLNMGPAQAQLLIAVEFMGNFQGLLVDTILLVRLITVHPLNRVGLVRFALITTLPITLKVARMANFILYTEKLVGMVNDPSSVQEIISSAWLAGPYMKLEWIAQVLDNGYASIAFLLTIRSYRTNTSSGSHIGTASFRESSFAKRLRILTNVALSNFIIPTILSIVQLACIFRFGETNGILLADISYVNGMVTVFGVVFATVWAGKEHRHEENMPSGPVFVERKQDGVKTLEWRVRPTTSSGIIASFQGNSTSSGTSNQSPSTISPV